MVSIKMKPIPPLEMGSETYQHTKRAFRHSRKLGPKSLSKTCMKVIKICKLASKVQEGREHTKQVRRFLHETLKEDPKKNMNVPQLQMHTRMVDVLIQSILQKGKGKRHGTKWTQTKPLKLLCHLEGDKN